MRRIKEADTPTTDMPARIGTAGWSIASRHAAHFPGSSSHLERYARSLTAVEINSSFYRPHRRETYERWAGATPAGFRFSVKLPRTITHEKRLSGCEALLDRFLAEADGLGDKLGVLLVQLPPSLRWSETAAAFLRLLRERAESVPAAVEPRHASWAVAEVEAVLVRHRIARVAADPSRFAGDELPAGWPGLAYFRLHGSPEIYRSDYPPDRLAAISARITAARTGGVETWCIFDNTALGHALPNALAVQEAQMMLSSRKGFASTTRS